MKGGVNGDRSTRGGDGALGTMGGNSTTSLGRDDDGCDFRMVVTDPPSPEGPGLGMNMGDGDLLLLVVCLLRKF